MPYISVIVPVYKVEQYLNRCVSSILAQSYKNFELILVDDGSPDNCPRMCDEYAIHNSFIHVIHQENGGLSAARNAGLDWILKNSNSEWVTFVDSDDWIHPQFLETMVNAAVTLDCDISMCQFRITEKYSDTFECNIRYDYSREKVVDIYENEKFIANGANAKLYKKELFKKIRYPVGKIHEDRFTTYKILFQYDKVAVVHYPLFFYFINYEGIIHSKWTLRRLDNIEAAEQQIKFFEEHGLERPYWYTMKECIQLMVSSLREMKKYKEYNNESIAIRKKLRKIIKQHAKVLDISFPKDITVYKYAYPFEVKVYQKILRMLKKN